MLARSCRIALLMIASVCATTDAQDKDKDINIRPGLKEGFQVPQNEAKPPAEGKPFPIAATIVAVVSAIVILMILCTPSRRS